jgi:Mrp family chromosome partitioning ATPase
MDVLPAGIIPPNPAELLSGALLEEAIAYLSSKYDYVILDTPPVGLVSDTLSIGRLANLTIFVTRTDFTPKANFDLINSISKSGKLPKCNIVINGVDFNKRRYAQQYGHYGHYRHYGSYGNYASRSQDVRTEK